jgi:hypothetical protein
MSDKTVDQLVQEFEATLAQHGRAVPKNILRDGIIKDMKTKLGSQLPEVHALLMNCSW